MKAISTLTILLIISYTLCAQQANYSIRGKYQRAIQKSTLCNAKYLSDIIPAYPSSWISSYADTELEANVNGKTIRAKGLNAKLSTEQKKLLQSLNVANELTITVNYAFKNAVSNTLNPGKMEIAFTVIPVKEAVFTAGDAKLKAYFAEAGIQAILDTLTTTSSTAELSFSISKLGLVDHVKLEKSSGDLELDKQIIRILKNMPQWQAAKNEAGLLIDQEFQFSIGKNNDGC